MFDNKRLQEENISLKKEISRLIGKNNMLVDRSKDPAYYIESILERGIGWFDYRKMEQSLKSTYYADAQLMIKGEVFNNELDHYIADLIKFAANESRDFSAVMNVRASIVALETFRKRLGDIENPNKLAEPVDKFSPL